MQVGMGSTGVETKKEFIKEKYLERKHIGLFERDLIKKKLEFGSTCATKRQFNCAWVQLARRKEGGLRFDYN